LDIAGTLLWIPKQFLKNLWETVVSIVQCRLSVNMWVGLSRSFCDQSKVNWALQKAVQTPLCGRHQIGFLC